MVVNKRHLRATLRAEDGGKIRVYDDTSCTCEIHNVTVLWGEMSPIAQLATEEGLDVDADLECLMLSK